MALPSQAANVLLLLVITFSSVVRSQVVCPAPDERFDCHPELDPTRQKCEARGCCWDSAKLPLPGVPTCFYPRNYGGYRLINTTETDSGSITLLERSFPSPYSRDVQLLQIDFETYESSILRVKISDAEVDRFEAPYPKLNKPPLSSRTSSLNFDEATGGFNLSDGRILFDSINTDGFIFADQFIQISTLFNGRLFGIGEHRTNITLEPGWKRFSLFNYGGYPTENINEYGSHPFYMVAGEGGSTFGVFLHNSNAMDIMLSPKPALTFRTIGGILDFYFFLGPTPSDVVQQYTSLIGRSFMPPYWSLGFNLCKYGYQSLENMKAIWQRNRDKNIPYDVQWTDIDSMFNQNDFTYDPERFRGLPEFIDEIHSVGMKMVPIVDAGVSAGEPEGTYLPFDLGKEMDVLVKDINGSIFIGKVWNPNSTAFPDFTHPDIQRYWNQILQEYQKEIDFDGIWIDMNEPSNFYDGLPEGCPNHELEYPPYTPGVVGDKLATSTICMTAKQAAGWHYDIHNLYSISQADVTNQALRSFGKRPFVLSRSTFAGSGQYTGHWSGDTLASYYDLTKSIQELLTFNMYGVSLMGADVCGFRENTTPELCSRWFQLGSFYTFTRSHNDLGWDDQDPAVFDDVTVNSIRKSLNIRYSLLPYLYTLFFLSHTAGYTVARPLFFQYPEDPLAYDVETAFLWGSGLFIIPVLEAGATTVSVYCPKDLWYDFYTGETRECNGEVVTLNAPYDTIPLLIRGGEIITLQEPAVTTTESRKNGMQLIAAPSSNGDAEGIIYWDDGELLDAYENGVYGLSNFKLSSNSVSLSEVVTWATPDTPNLTNVTVLDVGDVCNVTLNGNPVDFYINPHKALTVHGFSVPLSEEFTIEWIK